MAATKLSHSSNIGGSRPFSRTNEILVETMQYIAPRKEQSVPDRLLESKIYSKLGQNEVVQARPAAFHFAGFEPGKTHRQVLRLANVSTEVQRMHVIPPQTKYFYIKYTKGDRLVSGLTLDCTIEFTPDEWRYYYDCIRIHSKGEENIIIPIHAYPVMSTSEFPENLTFPPVPVGYEKTRTIPLRCHAPIDFEFQMSYLQQHPAFRVEPMSGVVPANGEMELTVTFAPTEFVTACMRVQLVVSQFNAKPLVCTVTGSSSPGLAKEISEESYRELEAKALELERLSPIDMVRRKRKLRKEKSTSFQDSFAKIPEIERDGIRFPSNLDTPYAVAQVLNQQPGKLRAKDLREAVVAKSKSKGPSTRQMKEALFEQAIRQDVYEERQNQLRWQVKLGDEQITPKGRGQVIQNREEAWTQYRINRGDPLPDVEFHRRDSESCFRRTVRDASQIAEEEMKFDAYSNDMWAVRHAALDRFTQAARKVIIRIRANRKLSYLRQMILDWGKKKYTTSAVSSEHKEKLEDTEEVKEETSEFVLSPEKVNSITFPTYAPPDVKDDMAVDALGPVPYKPTEVIVKKNVPYRNLKVPQHYRLMAYGRHDVHTAASGYVPPNLSRPLRTGAEEEIINLPVPNVSMVTREASAVAVNEGDLLVEDVKEELTTASSGVQLSLRPPEALFKPIDYPPLHIFNPAPGLQVFQAPLPYAEVDPDFHLCPLPSYTSQDDGSNQHTITQKRYLDREDVIRGVMTWKKFPSQGLTSLSNTPTLTNVWVPRWSEPFGSDLLPHDVPPVYESLPDSEKDSIADEEAEEEEDSMTLTPEMVNAQFALIDPAYTPEEKPKEDMFPYSNKMPATNIPVSVNGPVPREKREKELDFFLNKKYNKLGTKINSRLQHMDNLKTNKNLHLN